jgi:hypothetical protein
MILNAITHLFKEAYDTAPLICTPVGFGPSSRLIGTGVCNVAVSLRPNGT